MVFIKKIEILTTKYYKIVNNLMPLTNLFGSNIAQCIPVQQAPPHYYGTSDYIETQKKCTRLITELSELLNYDDNQRQDLIIKYCYPFQVIARNITI